MENMRKTDSILPDRASAARSISAVVPNFNYSQYLRGRITSILAQTYPTSEVIVLDDASTDNSVHQLKCLQEEMNGIFKVVTRAYNSGSVFKQWYSGAEQASGELIWIAEADDQADSTQVAKIVQLLASDPSIVLAFCDSKSVDESGKILTPSYANYYKSITGDRLTETGIHLGTEFVDAYLSVKNIILNVSSVIWRRRALIEALERSEQDLTRLRLSGDWRIYIECLLTPRAKVGYVAEALNVHRRHSESVTYKLPARDHLAETAFMHQLIRGRLGLSQDACAAQDTALYNLAKQFGFRQSP